MIAAARKILDYKKGQAVFKEGEPVRGLYFLLAGSVKVHQSWGDDNDFILRFAGAGDVVGHRGQGAAAFPVSATALESTRVCFVTNELLEAIFLKDRPFLHAMMQLYTVELLKAEKRMRHLAVAPVKGRVAETLLTMMDLFGLNEHGCIRLAIRRLDIASYAGTTYEAVFRLLTQWSRNGLVETSGKFIRIIDLEKLADMADNVS
jgi:CRP/FNR family transcriptional regulator